MVDGGGKWLFRKREEPRKGGGSLWHFSKDSMIVSFFSLYWGFRGLGSKGVFFSSASVYSMR